jgi:hypothetical protein
MVAGSLLPCLTLLWPCTLSFHGPAAKACKVDADKFCNVTWFFGYKAGQIISCLRDVKNQVTKNCKAQLFKVQLDVSVCVCVREIASSLAPTSSLATLLRHCM